MSSAADLALVNKVWNYAHVLRDAGVSYGEYVEQITCLFFLKMDQERADDLGEPSIIPAAASLGEAARPQGRGAGRSLHASAGGAVAQGRACSARCSRRRRTRSTIQPSCKSSSS